MSELFIPPVNSIKKQKRKPRPQIIWTEEMLQLLIEQFPFRFNKDIARQLNIGWRSVVRKARELNLEKQEGFLDKNREQITLMAIEAHPPHPFKGVAGWAVPNSSKSRFQKGNPSIMKDPLIAQKVHQSRNATIKSERLRIKYGLPQKTKLRLDPYKA